jgi:olfactory receptor
MKSKEETCKALYTYASHFVLVSILYGSGLLMYAQPSSVNEGDKNTSISTFYTVVIPLLNPFIYTLRNQEVITVVKRLMKIRKFSYFQK